MSDSQRAPDRKAAFTGLILGVIALGIVISTIVFLTNRRFEGKEGAKPAASASQQG